MKLQFMLRIQMESCKYLFSLSFKRSELEQAHRKMIDGAWWCDEQYSGNVSACKSELTQPCPHRSQLSDVF